MEKEPSNWAIYSQIAIQMLITIAGGTLFGVWLDDKFSSEPMATLVLSLLSIFIAIYNVIRQLPKL